MKKIKELYNKYQDSHDLYPKIKLHNFHIFVLSLSIHLPNHNFFMFYDIV
jgi:hypothetical protein